MEVGLLQVGLRPASVQLGEDVLAALAPLLCRHAIEDGLQAD
jgi:hypothetical protein